MNATLITTARRNSRPKLGSECESRHKSRHDVAIVTSSTRQIGYPAKYPAILAGYAEHASGDVAIAPTVGMSGKAVVKESLITAEGLQALDKNEQQAKRKGEKK